MPHAKDPRPLAAFDIDGTILREQLLVLLLKECFTLQIFPGVTEFSFKKVRLAQRDRKISHAVYDKEIIRMFEERIPDKLEADVMIAAELVAEKNRDWMYSFSRTLLETLQPTHSCITITGAMRETVKLLAPYWGFEHFYATEMEIDRNGRYTGRTVSLPVADKKKFLLKHAKAFGSDLSCSVALGDTSSDISMLASVSFPIAFNPSNSLATEAERRGWPVVIERKDCIFVCRGNKYRRFTREHAADAVHYALEMK